MPICQQCLARFPGYQTIDGKKRNLSHRKWCLSCQAFGSPRRRGIENKDQPCIICNKSKKRSKGRRCVSCETKVRRYATKKAAVLLLGGKCSSCGWDKDIAAMQFHHLDPKTKSFSVGLVANKSWAIIVEELKKCILLCANCHWIKHTVRTPAFFEEIKRYKSSIPEISPQSVLAAHEK